MAPEPTKPQAKPKNATLGWVLILGASLLFGLNASTSKVLVASGISPEVLVIYRSAFTAALAAVAVLLHNPKAFRVQVREWPGLIAFGIVGIGIMQWSYTNAVSRLPVGISLLFEYTAAIWVPLFSWIIFKQRAGKQLWFGAALALAGLLVVSQIWHSQLDPVGVGFGFLAAASVTFYFIIAERTQNSRDSYSTLFYTMLISTVFWLVVNHPSIEAFPNLHAPILLGGSFGGATLPTWVMLIWIGAFGSFLPMLLTYLGLRNLGATAAGIGSTAEVIFAFLFGWLWLQEDISGIQLLGAVFVLVGIGIAQSAKGKRV